MSYSILISDKSDYISTYSSILSTRSRLLNRIRCKSALKGLYYTSVDDVDELTLLPLCADADEVVYCPPLRWESEDLKIRTEKFLTTLLENNVNVKGFDPNYDKRILNLKDNRKTNNPQLWIVGCSYAAGRGLDNNNQRYGVLLAEQLAMKYSDVCEVASGIDWAADQILRSDIQEGDIVVWGITGVNRTEYYINNERWFSTISTIQALPDFDQKFFERLLTDDNIVYWSIKRIAEVVNFCRKTKARLVLLHHSIGIKEHNDMVLKHISDYSEFLSISERIDNAPSSSLHPGPATNKVWAEEIYHFLKS